MSRWGHGHSLGAGVLVGLLLSRRPELVYAAGILTGVLVLSLARLWRRAGALLGDWLDRHSDRTTVHLHGYRRGGRR